MSVELSIVIPAYNEQERIRPTLEEYVAHFRTSHTGSFEVIVVLNGCRDDTRSVVEAVAANAAEIRLVEFQKPLGKGGALYEGLGRWRKASFSRSLTPTTWCAHRRRRNSSTR